MYRAPMENATGPSAWELVQSGSFLHWEGKAEGGIFGQTFSGAFTVLFYCFCAKTDEFERVYG